MTQEQNVTIHTGDEISPKKPYDPPRLVVYGDVRKITQTNNVTTSNDHPITGGGMGT